MNNPFIKFGSGSILIKNPEGTWESLGELKKGSFKIDQKIDEIPSNNSNTIKVRAKSASILGEIENINIELISNFQDNYTFLKDTNKKELTLTGNSRDIKPMQVKLVNSNNENKSFTIELFNSFIKDSLSFAFGEGKDSPIFKQQIEFLGLPNADNEIFKIIDEQ